jgi:hypothetical protein
MTAADEPRAARQGAGSAGKAPPGTLVDAPMFRTDAFRCGRGGRREGCAPRARVARGPAAPPAGARAAAQAAPYRVQTPRARARAAPGAHTAPALTTHTRFPPLPCPSG